MYRPRVYLDRPDYADFSAPAKFETIISIIGKRLVEHPNAICSYSGGSDSDIMIDLIERARKLFELPEVRYVFFNTGLEMKAIKDHVKYTEKKYGVAIEECRPKMNIIQATRKYGIPFGTKIISQRLEDMQKRPVPLSLYDEFQSAQDKPAKRAEFDERYPGRKSLINFVCGCNSKGNIGQNSQFYMSGLRYFREFYEESPPDFKISAKCCYYCKKQLAHRVQKGYDMFITGERKEEGGIRSIGKGTQSCFSETSSGQYRLKPLYWVTDKDKAWYKAYYNIRYSDAYEVYGLTRTGCCGCSISSKAVEDLEKIRPYEPNLVKAAWNVFGESYKYRKMYNEYKEKRKEEEKKNR